MKTTTKRFLSLLIAVVMVVSVIPMSAIAAEPAYVAQIGEQGYETLQAAFDAVKSGETITLNGDITITAETAGYTDGTYTDGVRYTGDKSFTVDFNGFTVTDNGCVNDYLVYVNNKGTTANEVTFKNGTIASKNGCWATVCVNSGVATNATVLNLDDMKVVNCNDAAYSGNLAVRARNLATVNINKDTVVTSDGASYGVAASTSDSTVNINSGATVIQKNSGTTGGNSVFAAVGGTGVVNINAGATITSDKYGVHTMTTGTPVVNVYGGTITAPVALKASTNGAADQLATINVTGGTINGKLETYTNNGNIVVTGGTFDTDVSDYCAEGFKVTENADGSFGVSVKKDYVAMVGTQGYETLQDAVNAANGETVKLIADIELTNTLEISKSVTLDLNGKTVSGVTNADSYAKLVHVANGATLTVNDTVGTGKITYGVGQSNVGATIWVEGNLVLNAGTIELTGSWNLGFAVDVRPNAWGTAYTEATTFVINGGKVDSSDTAVRVASNSSDSYEEKGVSFTMNNGEIVSGWDAIFVQHLYVGDLDVKVVNGTVSGSNSVLRVYGGAGSDIDMAVEGGSFTGAIKVADAYADADPIVVSGGTFDTDVSDYCAPGYEITDNGNGTFGVAGTLPNATIENMGITNITEYSVYDLLGGGGLADGTDPIKLQVALNFLANDTEAEAKANAYANYTTDFYITLSGMANGSIVMDEDCYLAGNYGTFGWIVIPLNTLEVVDGTVYPVITSVGLDFKYQDIVTDVKNFKCGIHLSDAVLAANPDLEVNLELGLSETMEEAQRAEFITVGEPNVYDVEYLKGKLPNAEVVDMGITEITDYDIWNGSKLVEGGDPIMLQVALNFLAKDTVEEAKANAYANFTTDFFITMSGMANGTIAMDSDCYLAGNYGTWGWIMVPLEGMVIENGKIYPVITSVGFDFKYVDIVKDVKDFKCGIHLSDAVLEANPDLEVKLELGLSESKEAALNTEFITVDEPYIYTVADLKGEETQPVGTIEHAAISLSLEDVVYINLKVRYADWAEDFDFANNMGVLIWTGAEEDYSPELLVHGNPNVTAYPSVATFEPNSNGNRWVVQTPGIPAAELYELRYMRVYVDCGDGNYAYAAAQYYGARKYAVYAFAKLNDNFAAAKRTVAALLNYGAAAQVNFGVETDDLVNVITEEFAREIYPNYTNEEISKAVNGLATYSTAYTEGMLDDCGTVNEAIVGEIVRDNAVFTNRYRTLELLGNIVVKYRYKLGENAKANASEMKALYWTAEQVAAIEAVGGVLTAENASFTTELTLEADGRYLSEVPTAAAEVDDTLYSTMMLKTTDGKVYYSGVVAYSPNAYLQSNVNGADADAAALCKALVVYGAMAKAQFGG